MTTTCKHCGKTFEQAMYYGCNQWPCVKVPGVRQKEEVSREDIQKARQKITDVKNVLEISSLVHICGYPVEDLVAILEDSISHLGGDKGEDAWKKLVKEAQELGLY